MNKKIILASASPRRKELLMQAGIPFEVIVSEAQERITQTEPAEIVKELSLCKAKAVAEKLSKEEADRLILGADTIVVQNKTILGKPKSEKEAFQMIQDLQGETHEVYTGVTFLQNGRIHSFFEKTEVQVYPMTEEEIRRYVESGDCMDKAGAYGIQGNFAIYIRGIVGDYYTVVGLPVARVYQELKQWME